MKEEKKNNRKEMASFLNDKHGGKYLIFNFDGNYNDSMAPQWELFGFQVTTAQSSNSLLFLSNFVFSI